MRRLDASCVNDRTVTDGSARHNTVDAAAKAAAVHFKDDDRSFIRVEFMVFTLASLGFTNGKTI